MIIQSIVNNVPNEFTLVSIFFAGIGAFAAISSIIKANKDRSIDNRTYTDERTKAVKQELTADLSELNKTLQQIRDMLHQQHIDSEKRIARLESSQQYQYQVIARLEKKIDHIPE